MQNLSELKLKERKPELNPWFTFGVYYGFTMGLLEKTLTKPRVNLTERKLEHISGFTFGVNFQKADPE